MANNLLGIDRNATVGFLAVLIISHFTLGVRFGLRP